MSVFCECVFLLAQPVTIVSPYSESQLLVANPVLELLTQSYLRLL